MPNYSISTPMWSFKHLQREKVHFSWNISNNISCMAYFKKSSVQTYLCIVAFCQLYLQGRFICNLFSIKLQNDLKFHGQDTLWKSVRETYNSGGVIKSSYAPGSPKNWDSHQPLLQCLLYPTFQITFLKAGLLTQPIKLLSVAGVVIFLKIFLPCCAAGVGTCHEV